MGHARHQILTADRHAPRVLSGRRDRRAWRYRANVAARTVAATVGGYGVSGLFAAASACWLPLPRIEAAMPGTMLAFFVMPGVAIWAFLAPSAQRAWGAILLVAALMAMLIWLAPR